MYTRQVVYVADAAGATRSAARIDRVSCRLDPRSKRQRPRCVVSVASPQLRITLETAEVFGTIAATLKKARRHPNVRINDLWLAAQAVQRDLKLLTSNPKDFKDIPGLKVITLPRPRVG